jgi:hypothetical protein
LSPQQHLRNGEGLWSMFCEVGIADHKDIGNLDAFQATLCNAVSLKRESHFLLYCHHENMRENMPKHRKRCAGSIWDAGVKKKSLSYREWSWPFSLAPASGLRSRTEWDLSSSRRTDLQFSPWRFVSRVTLTSHCSASCNVIHGYVFW